MAGRKRGQGEGTIRRRADGRWEAMLTATQPDGTTQRVSFYGKPQREVREKLTAARRTLDQGDMLLTDRQTVGQFLQRWLADVVKPHREPKTYRTYEGVVRLHLTPTLGHLQLAALTPQH